jgi:hypothetical protein
MRSSVSVRFISARIVFSAIPVLILSLMLPAAGSARPERIRSGVVYYSDDYVEEGGVRDLTGEKNFEEVYQLYGYYEATYDEEGRVVSFREYVRGDLVRSETYRYDEGGELIEKRVSSPGKSDEVIRPAPEKPATP